MKTSAAWPRAGEAEFMLQPAIDYLQIAQPSICSPHNIGIA
jgi:hypothetical protein